ncbi:hypothetical protein M8J77_024880 [Diaphorina citri]|nr:hypothetical protein M8J77_024880 [Diaphorina citri]
MVDSFWERPVTGLFPENGCLIILQGFTLEYLLSLVPTARGAAARGSPSPEFPRATRRGNTKVRGAPDRRVQACVGAYRRVRSHKLSVNIKEARGSADHESTDQSNKRKRAIRECLCFANRRAYPRRGNNKARWEQQGAYKLKQACTDERLRTRRATRRRTTRRGNKALGFFGV